MGTTTAAVERVAEQLSQWSKAYPEDVFIPLTPEQTAQHSMIVTQASAGMARHMTPHMERAAALLLALAAERDALWELLSGASSGFISGSDPDLKWTTERDAALKEPT